MTEADNVRAIKLAVVGHTNVGKTSLLRTLTGDVSFGEVSHRPSTTRHVEGARLSVDGQALVDLYDTPGLEDAIALLDYLERLDRPGERLDGPARLARFLEGSEARQRFEQEAKVMRQLLGSDAGLYVIDAREPVLAKYRDELAVLASCGKPLLPVLNFVSAREHREPEWRESLSRLGLHALVRFDSVAPPEDGGRRLYESLALLLESARPRLERLIEDQEKQRRARKHSAARLIAELLIDCAACRRSVETTAEQEHQAVEALRKAVRQREQQCVEALLKLYAFRKDDVSTSDLPLMGVRVGGGVAAGAAAGAGVDLMVGGVTLGAAALVGAIAGGALLTARSYGGRLLGKLKGRRELTVDDAVLRLLALRQGHLLLALGVRGHAAIHRMELTTPQDKTWRKGKIPEPLTRARAHPQWSTLNSHAKPNQAERQEAIDELADVVLQD
ncbi:GTPase SAR1 [Pseudomonas savastanoi pv. retacarpa]|uniref:GTPase/DUF3482 domain-containing protein n=1 Tax=Pseudomonas savastanoi TaxID=29438 RepID=UPI0006E6BDDE|nr:GTPase/DUF3482 domain-containing protein [Pseudomonas savastanoi]KPY47291.1 GTP-binding protein [Pseudomonas savastanoi pv. retacarpa]OSR27629.1 GTPase SAR1 [Pseudomonas savastanoi pv. retacarpa]RML19710.1 GTP-binding protein [Pseudomonas savastanoi pv. retacarpa]RMP45209.1 GTP-binding protein [Pseudomonas savastanoi pv. retacarpa]